jgi:hypothetical protein
LLKKHLYDEVMQIQGRQEAPLGSVVPRVSVWAEIEKLPVIIKVPSVVGGGVTDGTDG